MEHFVTLFDKLYLPQGLVLHSSMVKNIPSFKLWILCVDDETYAVMDKLKLANVSLLKLSELETEDLLSVKPDRTTGEYCWTLTPFAPRFVFEADSTVNRVTYIDADLWFRKDPKPIFDEFDHSKKSVLITDHAYAPEFDQSETSGQYCVQFMIFERKLGECVRESWEQNCIEWCYNRVEDGKMGDQKYLDAWPDEFPDHVHVLEEKELCLMPWNATRFPHGNSVFYHFHGLRICSDRKVDIGGYPLPAVVYQQIYRPYLTELRASVDLLETNNFLIEKQTSHKSRFKNILKRRFPRLLNIGAGLRGYSGNY